MTKDNEDNDDKKYDVGYGKPPKSTRFGQIGGNKINRKGAPSKAQRLMKDRFSHEAILSVDLYPYTKLSLDCGYVMYSPGLYNPALNG